MVQLFSESAPHGGDAERLPFLNGNECHTLLLLCYRRCHLPDGSSAVRFSSFEPSQAVLLCYEIPSWCLLALIGIRCFRNLSAQSGANVFVCLYPSRWWRTCSTSNMIKMCFKLLFCLQKFDLEAILLA